MKEKEIHAKEAMLSTSDNPYNPFDEFNAWYAFDISKGYNTLSYLARLTETTGDPYNEKEDVLAINQVIEDAARINLTGNRIVVYCEPQ